MTDTYLICKGAGYFFSSQTPRRISGNVMCWYSWFTCPQCSGIGTVRTYSPPTIKLRMAAPKPKSPH